VLNLGKTTVGEYMKVGDIVLVVAKADEKIRDMEERAGTIVQITGDEVWVLLANGDIWVGSKRYVARND
jgi:hypothetical protein